MDAPTGIAFSAVGGAVVMKVIDWFLARRKDRTETDANIDLLNQQRAGLAALADRVTAMSADMANLRSRLEEEILQRMRAQEEAHRLRLRIMELESALRALGAVIPPEPREQG